MAQQELASHGFDADEAFGSGYVERELAVARHFFEAYDGVVGKKGLEFGCHLGGSAITLSVLGAHVDAVDVDALALDVARTNALRYRDYTKHLHFHHVPDTRSLPFRERSFDFVSCNSVLEYVDLAQLPAVLAELDRVLKPGGVFYILGTSNRLWPVESHTRRVLTNYVPRRVLRRIPALAKVRQGISYWDIAGRLPGYANLDSEQQNESYLRAKAKASTNLWRLRALQVAGRALGVLRVPAGILTPSICTALRKPYEIHDPLPFKPRPR